ncbi:MAG: hypothetical protein Q8M17_05365 [Actinomycetota bacterium]|nr:hypothetical protein [Actinomycetota bacterium]
MSITPTALTRTAGIAAIASGALFVAVQIGHPTLDAAFATTTEYFVREYAKVAMALLGLIGITGMYLRQVRQSGVLGLIGGSVFAAGFLSILTITVISVTILPTVAGFAPGYVDSVLAGLGGGTSTADIGALSTLSTVGGLAYMLGGLVFGIALFRANVLARWAAVVLSAGTIATVLLAMLPDFNDRLLAIPTGIAMIGLGYSLFTRASDAAAPVAVMANVLDAPVAR